MTKLQARNETSGYPTGNSIYDSKIMCCAIHDEQSNCYYYPAKQNRGEERKYIPTKC